MSASWLQSLESARGGPCGWKKPYAPSNLPAASTAKPVCFNMKRTLKRGHSPCDSSSLEDQLTTNSLLDNPLHPLLGTTGLGAIGFMGRFARLFRKRRCGN